MRVPTGFGNNAFAPLPGSCIQVGEVIFFLLGVSARPVRAGCKARLQAAGVESEETPHGYGWLRGAVRFGWGPRAIGP